MLYAVILGLIFIIFRIWFSFLPITSGDLGFFYREQIRQYFNLPFMWETFRNLGFGGDSFLNQGVYFYNLPFGILGKYLDYGVIERIIWFFPIICIGVVSPIILGRWLKIFSPKFYPLISFIYLLNTYFLMIIGGGQLTVVFGYIAIPAVFASFLDVITLMNKGKIILFGLIFSLLVAFDFRYAYIFLIIVLLYFVFSCIFLKSFSEVLLLIRKYLIVFFTALTITLGTQAYWILPYVLNFHNPTATLTSAYTSSDSVTFFSFARLENSLSLLHPLWPENIFGKVGFMKPEFLLIPILAFSSLLFLSKKRGQRDNQTILLFVVLGIVGAFFAKGAKPPFGEMYLLIFDHIPGFVMFRDPTKWYTLVALSYSILIPFSIAKIYELLSSKFPTSHLAPLELRGASKTQNSKLQFKIKKFIPSLFLLLVISYLLLLIRPAILGQLGGVFKSVTVPKEYFDLKNFLIADSNFSRVLWVPAMQRFSFYSDNHPAIPGKDFFKVYDQYGVVKSLQKKGAKELLENSAVKYVVVPDDSEKEIFIKDRKYDNKEYDQTIMELNNISWLKKVKSFKKISVYSLYNPKDHFWSNSERLDIQSKSINPTKYILNLKNAKKGDKIVFTESYSKNWQMKNGDQLIQSIAYNNKFNSFKIPNDGSYFVQVENKAQKYVLPGLIITSTFLIVSIFSILFLKSR